MNNRVLFVDDESHILEGLRRTMRKHCDVHTALGAQAGIQLLTSSPPFAVIVSDMRMPGMDGVEFLLKAKEICPDSVRMMLTGNADQETAVKAVNTGEVFRFLNKPCNPDVIAAVVLLGLRQYQLVTAEKELLDKTVKGSIEALADILAIVKPDAFGRVKRIRGLCKELAERVGIAYSWELDSAALLSPLGCVNLAPAILDKLAHGKELGKDELLEYQQHPRLGAELIQKIPRLEKVAKIVSLQYYYSAAGPHFSGIKEVDLPWEARILATVLAFEDLKNADWSDAAALDHVRATVGRFNSDMVEALATCVGAGSALITMQVSVAELVDGMIIAANVTSTKGVLLLCRGQEVKQVIREHLCKLSAAGTFTGTILVTRPTVG
jgi:response regulator RpfG family c-di-GMP phosphodiesterase